jgi:hypothetical protein
MDSLDLSASLNPPPLLDCLPSIVRKFSSPLLVAWKYVKTSGQESFSYREMEGLFMPLKFKKSCTLVVIVTVSQCLLMPIMVMIFLQILTSSQGLV